MLEESNAWRSPKRTGMTSPTPLHAVGAAVLQQCVSSKPEAFLRLRDRRRAGGKTRSLNDEGLGEPLQPLEWAGGA